MTMPGGGNDRQVNVTLNANVDPFVRSMTAANQATLKLGDTLKRIDDQVLRLTKRLGVGITAVGAGGLLATIGDVKTAAALENSFKALSAQSVVTGTRVGAVADQVIRLGTQIPVATRDLAAMTTQIASLGITGTSNLLKLTKQAEQLAAATNTAPGTLMTGLLEMNRALGGSIEDLSRYGSVLTALQAKMGVGATDIMNFASGIEAVANKAGITEKQILGLSAAFAKVGADGFAGAQAFNTVVNDMTDAVARNSPRMQQYANLLGISSEKFKEMVSNGNAAQAFIQFINAVSAQGSKASLILEQFGLDSVRTQRVFAALTSGQANLGQAMATTNQAFSENNAMADAAKQAWKGLDEQFIKISNASTEMKNALGKPLMQALTPLAGAFATVEHGLTSLLKFFNDAPWPIGDTITALVTKTPALLLVGGAFLTLTAAVAKFAGVWRMMTGAVGINAIRGFTDARRGNAPRELDGSTGRLGSLLYRSTYGMATNDGMIGVNARRSIGSLVMGYPFMRGRQQMGQAVDTMRHPLSPELRTRSATDPLSMYGVYQAAESKGGDLRSAWITRLRGEGSSDFSRSLADRMETGFGPMDESAEAARRKRFTYTETARTTAAEQQRGINATLGRRDLINLASTTEAGQYQQRVGSLEGFVPTNFENESLKKLRKMGNQQALWVGANAAKTAGLKYDASLTDEESGKLANPFAKLATKVKEITADLTKTTGTATKSVFGSIQTFFSNAMQKIIALAQATKAQIAGVAAVAANPGMGVGAVGGVSAMAGMPPVPPSVVRTAAKIQAEEAAKATATATAGVLPSAEEIARGAVIGFPVGTRLGGIGPRTGPNSRNVAPGVPAEGVPAGMERGGTASGFSPRSIGRALVGQDSWLRETALPATGKALSSVGSGLVGMASGMKSVLGAFMSPQLLIGVTLLGPAVWNLASKFIEAHKKISSDMDYAGAAVQQALGRTVVSQTDLLAQRDKTTSNTDAQFGGVERKNALTGEFGDKYKRQLDALRTLGGAQHNATDSQKSNTKAWLQNYVNGMVQGQNAGKPLDNDQLRQMRELVLNATGGDEGAAKNLLDGVDFSGGTPSNWANLLGSAYGKSGDKDLRATLSTTSVQNIDTGNGGGIASILAAAANSGTTDPMPNGLPMGSSGDMGSFGPKAAGNTRGLLEQFVNDYNEAHPKAKIGLTEDVNNVSDFIAEITRNKNNPNYRPLWNQLQAIGLSGKSTITAGDMSLLNSLASQTGNAGTDSATIGSALEGSVVNNAYRAVQGRDVRGADLSVKPKGYVTSLLTNPDDVGFSHNVDRMMGALNKGGTIFSADAITNLQNTARALQDVKDKIGSPSDPAWQQLDKLQQMTFTQLSSAAQLGGGLGFQLKTQTSLVNSMLTGGVTDQNHDDIQKQNDLLGQEAMQGIQQLQQYWVQVRDFHIQEKRGYEDHYRQLGRMQRDYNVQVKEANYQFGIQQREALYSYQIQQREQLYSFNESIRAMKYSIANSFGSPASMVQAQFTMGGASAAIGLTHQLDLLKRSKGAMDTLANQGLSKDAIRLFGLDDPKNVAQAERFITDFANNPQLVAYFNQQISDRLSIANAIAQDPNNSQFSELKRQFDHTAEVAAESFSHAAQVAQEAFFHSMAMSSEQMHRTMADFQQDYDITVARSLEDLSRLGEDTTKTWQDLIKWAQDSGIPGIQQLAQASLDAINAMMAATGQLQASLQAVTSGFSTTLSQLGSDWQTFVAKNPAFAAANGINTSQGNLNVPAGAPSANKDIVQHFASLANWGSGPEWDALVKLINSESGFRNTAQNPTSSAYGMFQFLDSTWAGVGGAKTSDPANQAKWGLAYISQRYGDPIKAWAFHQAHNSYAAGGVFDKATMGVIGESGPEAVLPLNASGASFMAQTLRATFRMIAPELGNEIRRGRTISSPMHSDMSYHHTDASTNYYGDMTVVASDPNEMGRKLAAKQRLTQLTKPRRS